MKRFTTYQFENNGDIFGVDEECDFIHIGRCDSDGDISLDEPYYDLLSDVSDVLFDTVVEALGGQIDWTPDERYMKAAGCDHQYSWDRREKKWVEA